VKNVVGIALCLGFLGTASAETAENAWLKNYIVTTPDFPKKGILFRSYANLLKEPAAMHRAIRILAERYRNENLSAVVGLDARGFIFGAALSYEMNVPFVMIRKSGKLPCHVERIEYNLEYGKNSFEIETGSLQPHDRVVIVDDLLATGGTAEAASQLVERLGAEVVEVACLIELTALHGREKMTHPVYSLIAIDDE
jgi:adenine phosphoribosyltransferase